MHLVLFVAFIVVPLVELYVIVQVGQALGVLPTILALLLVSVAGAALVKREGAKAWRRFRQTLQAGQMPAEEVVDGALLMLGGALMLTPGFLTDAVGLVLVVPPSRAVVNRLVRSRVRGAFGLRSAGPRAPRPGPAAGGEIVDVEVVSIERTPAEDEHDRSGGA